MEKTIGPSPSRQYGGDYLGRFAHGQIELPFSGWLRIGQPQYDTETGFWLGTVDGTPKLSIGNSAGNKLTWDGSTLSITGTLTATSGTIGGWTINATSITDTAGAVGMSSAVTGGDDIRFWAGDATPASAEFRVTEAGALTASNATITGTITASAGTIGGFTLGATTLTATNLILDSSGQRISLGSSNDIIIADADDATYRLWVGHATAASAPFSVTKAGAVTATNISITGGSVVTSVLSGLVGLTNTNVAAQGWTQTCAFSVTDSDTVTWGAGTFTTAAGTAYSISGSNTGNMAAKTYIYLDIGVSTTAYQTTTTAATAVGTGKVLVATAQNNTSEAIFNVLSGAGGQNIDASSIVALSITANEIAASTITSGKLTVSQLSAIAADMGSITAGTITLNSSGHIKSGQTAYNTGTGFFLGLDSGVSKFSIGDSSDANLNWDGTSLNLQGDLNLTGDSQITGIFNFAIEATEIGLTSQLTSQTLSYASNLILRVKNLDATTGGATIFSQVRDGAGDSFLALETVNGSGFSVTRWNLALENASSDRFSIREAVGGITALLISTTGTITSTVGIVPDANDGAFLGTSALGWSDLFLAEGGVIDWDNGDATLTQSGNTLTLAGADLVASGLAAVGTTISSTTILNLPASTTGVSSIRLAHGSAPSSPVNGDMWTTTAGLYVRINGVTVGPLT